MPQGIRDALNDYPELVEFVQGDLDDLAADLIRKGANFSAFEEASLDKKGHGRFVRQKGARSTPQAYQATRAVTVRRGNMNKLSISIREYWARTLELFQGGEMTSSLGKGGVVADLQVLIDSRLESALHCPSTPPVAVIVVGPIAAGETTHRKTRLGSGYVHIDNAGSQFSR